MVISNLELRMNDSPEDDRIFLNYWDYSHGDDVCAEFKNGSLYLTIDDKETLITLQEFIQKIKERNLE